MQMTKVACPLCQGFSPVTEPSPVGKSIHCQKCGAPFTIRAGDLRASHNGTAASANGTARLGVLVTPARPKVLPTARIAPEFAGGTNRGVAVGMVVGGLTLVLATCTAVALVAFSADSRPVERASAQTAEKKKPTAGDSSQPSPPGKIQDSDPVPPPDEPSPGIPEDPQPPAKEALRQKQPAPKPAPKLQPAKADRHGITADQQKKIDDAINHGVGYLKARQRNGGWDFFINAGQKNDVYPLGPTALAALTLLECGVPAKDKSIVSAAKYVRDLRTWKDNTHTYEISLAILFLDKLGDKNDKRMIQALALRLLKGQDPSTGGWVYDCPRMDDQTATVYLNMLEKTRPKPPITAIDKSTKKPLPTPLDKSDGKKPLPIPVDKNTDPLPPDTKKSGGLAPSESEDENEMPFAVSLQKKDQQKNLKKQQPPPKPRTDNSNTQFAMLALWAARRHGIPTENALALCERRFRGSQFPDGNWAYHVEDGPKSLRQSMTCVGLLGIALGKGSTAELALRGAKLSDPKNVKPVPIDDQVRKGINALNLDKYSPDGKQWPKALSLYFVWSVERIGVLYDLTKIGKQDWYHWGVDLLLPTQYPDGRWDTSSYHGANGLNDTCFALLFLKRVNLAQDLTDLNLFMGITDPNQNKNGP